MSIAVDSQNRTYCMCLGLSHRQLLLTHSCRHLQHFDCCEEKCCKKRWGRKQDRKVIDKYILLSFYKAEKTNTNSSYVHNYHTFSETSVTLLGLYFLSTEFLKYSKTCVKPRLSKRLKNGIQDQLSLNAGQKYCRMLHAECSKGSILQYFQPSLSYYSSLRSLFCLFSSGRFTQVLL